MNGFKNKAGVKTSLFHLYNKNQVKFNSMKKNYCVYRTTNLINGKTYIGQHKFDLNKDDKYLGSGVLISKAIKKYGRGNFKKEIIEVALSKFEVNALEKYYIAKERALGKAEYNISNGGEGNMGYRHTDEDRRKMSESHKGNIPWMKGKHHTEEAKEKNRQAHLGKKLSQEACKNISEGKKGKKKTESTKRKMMEYSKNRSEEHIRKLSEANQRKAQAYHKYKANGGTLTWNEFQKEYKRGLNNG